MNICIIGGGGPKGKFGRDLSDMLKAEGHNVFILSHKDYGSNDPQHMFADFSDANNVVSAFNGLTENINEIDILLYNSNANSYPGQPRDYTSTSTVNIEKWQETINIHCIIPHAIALAALKKMNPGSCIIFMTTGLSYDLKRSQWFEYAGYAGGKAIQNHLMLGLAHHNDRGVFCSSISSHFPSNEPERYGRIFKKIKNHILEIGSDDNGKIKEIWDH